MAEKIYLLIFELETLADLCRVLYWDFLIAPSPKLLFGEDNKLFFFSSCYIQGRKSYYLCFGFSVYVGDDRSKYLICYEDEGSLSMSPNEKAPASLYIFKTRNLLKKGIREINYDDNFLLNWAYLLEANEQIIEYMTVGNKKRILLMPTSAGYILSIGKNDFRIYRLNDIPTRLTAALFHAVKLYEVASHQHSNSDYQ